MEQYIDEFGNLQFREPSNNLPFKSMVDMAAENKNFMNQFNFSSADLNNVPVEISQLPIASVPNNFLNYRFQNARTPFTPFKEGIETLKSNVSSGIGKGFDLGKAAIGGIASLVSGIPGIGLLLNSLQPMSPEQKAMRDFYGSEFGLDDIGRVQSGIMQGYNPVSLFGGVGLNQAIDKRIARIQKTLQKKKSDTLQQRLKDLQALKAKEAAASAKALEAQRIGRRPSAPSGGGGTKDSGGPTGGYSYDSGGRQGFGYGLKNGGLVSLL
jgi:hypothetical protein